MEISPARQIVSFTEDSVFQRIQQHLQKLNLPPGVQWDSSQGLQNQAFEDNPHLCILLDLESDAQKVKELFASYPSPHHFCLFYKEGNPPEKIRAFFKDNPFLKGIISGHNEHLLSCGLRLNTHLMDKDHAFDTVKQCSFFKHFSTEECQELLKQVSLHAFCAGETLIEKTDPSDFFLILLQGQAETMIFQDINFPTILPVMAGEPLGEIAVIDNAPRSGICIAADECIVMKINAQILSSSTILPRKIYHELLCCMANRLRSANKMIVSLKESGEKNLKRIPKLKSSADKKEKAPPPKFSAKKKETSSQKKVKEKEEEEEVSKSPYSIPTGTAEVLLDTLEGQEEYDVLKRKIHLRTDFILGKIPRSLADSVQNKLFGYLTGGKLSRMNPHEVWDSEWFAPGTPRLMKALHMVVCCRWGHEAYQKAYLNLPFSHRVIGLLHRGCVGTFLGCEDDIKRFCKGDNLKEALPLDFEIPIDRLWEGAETIDFLTHTTKDVRTETLFMVYDAPDGATTKLVRETFPSHQIITFVEGFPMKKDDPMTLYNSIEEKLAEQNKYPNQAHFKGEGFYQGETFFLSDLEPFFQNVPALQNKGGTLFAGMGILAQLGPDYSGIVWGSKGGAEGAVRAARAMFGISGPQSSEDLADAVNWADQ